MEIEMPHIIQILAIALTLASALGIGFMSSASAKPHFGPSECVVVEGYGRYSNCHESGGG